jgi:hypothetical protein
VQEAAQAGVGVDEAELGRRHPELDAVAGDAQVAGQRQLQAAADRVARQRRDRRDVGRVERVDRARERVGDELLGLGGEDVGRDVADVIAGGEHPAGAGEDQRADAVAIRCPHGLGDPVEDRVVQRVALRRIGDGHPPDPVQRRVDQQLARH